MGKKTITVQGNDIRLMSLGEEDYISLTDISAANDDRPDLVIQNWMRNKNTVIFLAEWEIMHNEEFNSFGFEGIKNRVGDNSFSLSVKKWINETNAKGIQAKTGRYGGTYAHKDIAFAFGYWLNARFQLYVIKEFQRLKEIEAEQNQGELTWNLNRTLSKINYSVHTDAIKEKLIPQRITSKSGFVYANEADVLNIALFNMTAKEWRAQNPNKKGNIRDEATTEQLLVLANLEAINAELIRMGLSQDERSSRLNEAAISQMQSLLSSPSLRKLPKGKS